jgi:hypothetical protein
MGLMRLGISNPSANTDVAIYTATGPFLASIIATNKSASATSNVRMWIVPSGATLTSQYAYLAYDQDIVPQNTLETHRFALNQNDVVYVRADTADMSFMINGLKQVDIALAAGVTSYSNTAPVDVMDGMIWVDKDGNGTALNTLAGQVIQSSASTQVTLTLRGAASQTADIFDVQNSAGTDFLSVNKDGVVKKPVQPIISGQMGTNSTFSATAKVPFDEFWVNQGGIVYNSSTRRFTVPVAGIYRIVMNPFTSPTAGTRVLIGINNDAPGAANHYGHSYSGDANHQTHSLNSVVSLSANDYIVFYLYAGTLYNASNDRFNQFSIELIG